IKEQYTFCYQNDLKHVWAYLWSEWYQPEAWKLWARASSSQLNILRTTMTIEITKVIPCQINHLQLLRDDRCISKWREELRLEWKKLATHIINPNTNHITDFSR
ncbi:61_t:CDS:2, partial [Racocetra persica]